MLSDNFKKWWSMLPPDAKKEVSYATGIDLPTLRNMISLKRSPTSFHICAVFINYSDVLHSKYGTPRLTPHDLDTSSNIKVFTPIKG